MIAKLLIIAALLSADIKTEENLTLKFTPIYHHWIPGASFMKMEMATLESPENNYAKIHATIEFTIDTASPFFKSKWAQMQDIYFGVWYHVKP